jgi:hypothetical protein
MRQFPQVVPSSRSFGGGGQRVQVHSSISGKETRVLLGDTALDHRLELGFNNMLEAGVKSIIDHWVESAGGFHSFRLPSSVFAGWSNYTAAVSTTQQWRYDGQPQVEAVSPGIMSVSVVLISVA